MGILQRIFRRPAPETRASGTGFTSQVIAARADYITGRRGVAELTATVQACAGLWESGLGLADVAGTDLLDRRALALAGRALALRGESVFLIRDRLAPAFDWDVTTRDGEPRAYRLSLADTGGARSVTALAGEVLHFRHAASPAAPWAGSAPLARAGLTAGLLHALEAALAETFENAPLGSQIIPLPEGAPEDMAAMRSAFRGRRGESLVVEGVALATAAGMNPQLGQKREDLSPDLSRSMTAETLAAAREAILLAFGVLPALANRAATGPVIREAQRHLATWQLQPLAAGMAEEAAAKLGAPVEIDTLRPLQAFDAGGRARALSAIVGAIAQAKADGLTEAELAGALRLVDWQGGGQE